ncbi:hypothetical protein PM082_009151 [Marasmius tenuissimus]|nr:hypothetical protein PM082_009151 [Marasmius tenuissimus]
MIEALQGQPNNNVTLLLFIQIGLNFSSVEVVEVGMLDDPTLPINFQPLLVLVDLLVLSMAQQVLVLIVVNFAELVVTISEIAAMSRQFDGEQVGLELKLHVNDDTLHTHSFGDQLIIVIRHIPQVDRSLNSRTKMHRRSATTNPIDKDRSDEADPQFQSLTAQHCQHHPSRFQ